jgi:hypothetical protein
VEEATKTITALHWTGCQRDHAGWFMRSALAEPLVRPSLVVVLDELDQHPFQVSPTEDERVVEHLPTGCPHPSLRERVGVSLQLQLIGTIQGDFESSIRSIRWLVGSSSCSATSTPGASNSVCSIEKLGASGHVRCRLLGLT